MKNKEFTWIFDEPPPSGARRGGNIAEYAFESDPTLETFIREILQNSKDQALGSEPVEVTFEFIHLSGTALKKFKQSIDWNTLKTHLESVPDIHVSGKSLKEYLNMIQRKNELLLLRIEDRKTRGLKGPESGGDSNFTALCKDTLYSHHKTKRAGGSYGLGKAVLWIFSGLSTVFFNSSFESDNPERNPPRFIGRSELPSHTINGKSFEGPGWFGKKASVPRGFRAESIWGKHAEKKTNNTYLDRKRNSSGTSILILGFRAPTRLFKNMEELAEGIEQLTPKYFWPALHCNSNLKVDIKTPTAHKKVKVDNEEIHSFTECYEAYHNGTYKAELTESGDIAIREIPVDIPNKADGTSTTTGKAVLSVKLAEEKTTGPLLNHVAFFRGPGMIVKYHDKRNISLGARPFYATLFGGTARNPTNPTKGDLDLEEFLRAAEPPTHNKWTSTRALTHTYERGSVTTLRKMKKEAWKHLRDLVISSAKTGERGPDKLRKRFMIGKGREGRKASSSSQFFHFKSFKGRRQWDSWIFSGTLRTNVQNHEGWTTAFKVFNLGERYKVQECLPIENVAVEPRDIEMEFFEEEKKVRIIAPPHLNEIDFKLTCVIPLNCEEIGEVMLDVKGRVYSTGE